MKYLFCILLVLLVSYCRSVDENQRFLMFHPKDLMMERLLERLPIYDEHKEKHTVKKELQKRADKLNDYIVQKRNNAELVNHILKNLDALDILGEVG